MQTTTLDTNKKRYVADSLEELILPGFMKHVNQNGKGACWIWKGPKHSLGYGKFSLLKGTFLAHRISWLLFRGSIPKGMFLCHRCDNPSCVNPEHLFLGTPKENTTDMVNKGRLRYGTQIGKIGLQSISCRFKKEDVLFIRGSKETHVALAKQFNVSPTAIRAIRIRRSYQDVK